MELGRGYKTANDYDTKIGKTRASGLTFSNFEQKWNESLDGKTGPRNDRCDSSHADFLLTVTFSPGGL